MKTLEFHRQRPMGKVKSEIKATFEEEVVGTANFFHAETVEALPANEELTVLKPLVILSGKVAMGRAPDWGFQVKNVAAFLPLRQTRAT